MGGCCICCSIIAGVVGRLGGIWGWLGGSGAVMGG